MRKFAIIVLLTCLLGCQENLNRIDVEDASMITSDVIVSNNRLVFNSIESYKSTLALISNMSDTEFSQWEKDMGFKSFKTICNEEYNKFLSNPFQTTNKLIESVPDDSRYYFIVEDENGEITLETRDRDLLYNSIIASDRTFQIGTTVYKSLVGSILYTSIENLDILSNIDETNCEEFLQYEEINLFKVSEKQQSAKKGSSCYTCDIDGDHINVSAKRKVYLRLYVTPFGVDEGSHYSLSVEFHAKSISYKKVLGIWVKYNTTHIHNINCYNISWSFDPDADGSVEVDYYRTSSSTTKEYNTYYTQTAIDNLSIMPTNLDSDLTSWDCRARTAGTNPEWVVLQCNLPIPMAPDCSGF